MTANIIGEKLDQKYRIIRILGRRGFGDVYLAKDNLARRHIAIKRLLHGEAEPNLKTQTALRTGAAKSKAFNNEPNDVSSTSGRAFMNSLRRRFSFSTSASVQCVTRTN